MVRLGWPDDPPGYGYPLILTSSGIRINLIFLL